MASPQQQAHALVTYFINSYKDKYGREPKVNRYQAKWGFTDILADNDPARVRHLIDFYFRTNANHTVTHLMSRYDELLVSMDAQVADEERRRKLRSQTRKRVEEYRRSVGQTNGTD